MDAPDYRTPKQRPAASYILTQDLPDGWPCDYVAKAKRTQDCVIVYIIILGAAWLMRIADLDLAVVEGTLSRHSNVHYGDRPEGCARAR